MDNKSLTVIIPAYREARNLKLAYESVLRILQKAGIHDYEIFIITNTRRDGSHDGTPDIAAQIAKENKYTKFLHNNRYVGLGYKYRQGIKAATKNHVILIPSSGEFIENSVVEVLKHISEAEIIVTYNANPGAREFKRRFVSKGFTLLCNILFGLNLKYYNGLNILPRRYVQNIPLKCDGFTYMAEIIIYLVKSNISYVEIPWEVKPAIGPLALHSAFNFRSVFEAIITLASLFWKIHFLQRRIVANSS